MISSDVASALHKLYREALTRPAAPGSLLSRACRCCPNLCLLERQPDFAHTLFMYFLRVIVNSCYIFVEENV